MLCLRTFLPTSVKNYDQKVRNVLRTNLLHNGKIRKFSKKNFFDFFDLIYWQINDTQMIEMAKHCNKLQHIELECNFLIKDNGLVNGLFAHCVHLESLHIYECFTVTG